jgi:hypothetical protein
MVMMYNGRARYLVGSSNSASGTLPQTADDDSWKLVVFVFAQLMDFLPRHEFDACVRRYEGDRRPRGFSCPEQYLCLAFAQLTFHESLRDIETCLRAFQSKLYHAGFRGKISRSTLADANHAHDSRIYADLAQLLINRARTMYMNDPIGSELEQTVYALDSTTIDLCLSLFPWATFRQRKGAVKLHALVDLRGNIPCFIRITNGKTHDVKILDQLPIEPGSFYVMDRGYVDFKRLYRFTTNAAFFLHVPNLAWIVEVEAAVPSIKRLDCVATRQLFWVGIRRLNCILII